MLRSKNRPCKNLLLGKGDPITPGTGIIIRLLGAERVSEALNRIISESMVDDDAKSP
jgi:hypothetical protein